MINAVNEFLDDLRGGKMSESPIVSVSQGQLLGRLAASPSGKPYYCFQGIPYAKPPLGSLRFQAPQPAEPWTGIRDATTEGAISSQKDCWPGCPYLGSENCLFLNVHTPRVDGESLPVMVYVHGGGFRAGSGNAAQYGADYLVEKDVVVVTLNYRVGPLGFLCLNTPEVPGNAGLKDIILALNWVKENIGQFGGNSGNLTIFGESAGGVVCSLFTASPLTKDLISKSIVQSGTCLSNWAWQKHPIDNAKALAKQLGCDSLDVDEILEFLRSTSAQEIAEAYCVINPDYGGVELKEPHPFVPVIEKEFPNVEPVISQPFVELLTAGKVADIPLMIGTTDLELCMEPKTDDLRIFIPHEFNIERQSSDAVEIAKELERVYFNNQKISVENWHVYFELLTDRFDKIDTYRHVKFLSNFSKKPVYVYEFDYYGKWNSGIFDILATLGIERAVHTDELGYLFRSEKTDAIEGSSQDVLTRERMVRLWTNFAKSGNPTPEENSYINVAWQPATRDTLYYLKIANELSLETNPEKERMELWEKLYQKYYKIWEQPKSNEDFIPVSKALGDNIIAAEKSMQSYTESVTKVSEEHFDEKVVQETVEVVSETQVFEPEAGVILDQETGVILDQETGVCLEQETPKIFEEETLVSVNETVAISQSESVVETKIESHHFQSESHHVSNFESHEVSKLESHQVSNSETHQTESEIHQIESETHQISETDSVVTEKVQISESESVFKSDSLTNLDIVPVAETVAKLQMFNNKTDIPELQQKKEIHVKKDSSWIQNGGQQENGFTQTNGSIPNGDSKKSVRTSNEIKMVATGNGDPKDVIRANDPPEDDLPKNIGVNKFVNFFESLGGKK